MDWIDWARGLFGLIATLALIVGAAFLARRFGMIDTRKPAERRMRVVETLMLDPRRRLVMVRVDDREHLLLLSPAGDRPIFTAEAAREEAEAAHDAQ